MRTFGKLELDRRTWYLDAEPQVAMHFKRCFGRVGQGLRGTLTIVDTLEVCRNLAWFLLRYPLVLSAADAAYLAAREHQHRELAADVARIISGDYTPTKTELALPLRGYQQQAVDLARRVKRLLIGDDLGIGKTAELIGIIADPAARPAMVACMTHLPPQLKREIERFLPGIRVHIVEKATAYDLTKERRPRRRRNRGQMQLLERGGLPDVILISYSKLAGWAEELAGKVRTVAFDECQEVRRPDSEKYAAAKRIADAADIVVGLSGTPIYNYGGEIWNVMEVLAPGVLGSWQEFCTEWCKDSTVREKAQLTDPKALGCHLRELGHMIRRTRGEVKRELPKLEVIEHQIGADTTEIDKVASAATELAKLIVNQGGPGFDKLKSSQELSWKLRHATGVAKAFYVADFVRMLIENGERVLLYGWHLEVYALWAERLHDLEPVFYTGEQTTKQKEAAKEKFINGEARLMIMSLRAGAGVDGLQKVSRTVVFGEIDWSPGVHEQAVGRVYRDGQVDPVTVYFLLADCGSDPVVADVLGIKRAQLQGINNPKDDLIEQNQVDPDKVKRLAEDFLRQRGLSSLVPSAESDAA